MISGANGLQMDWHMNLPNNYSRLVSSFNDKLQESILFDPLQVFVPCVCIYIIIYIYKSIDLQVFPVGHSARDRWLGELARETFDQHLAAAWQC